MKHLRKFALFVVLGSLLLATAAEAQTPTIGVYFGPNRVSSTNVVPNTQFKIWVMLTGMNDAINAVEYKLNLPSNVVVLQYDYYGANPLVFGSTADGVAVGFGECVPLFPGPTTSTELVVAELTAMAITSFPSTPVTITRYEGNPQSPSTAPRYNTCDGTLIDLVSSDGALFSSVAVENTTFGAVKALY